MSRLRVFSLVCCFLLMFSLFGCGKKRTYIEPADGWYATWLAAPEKAEAENVPENPTLRGSTCRQQIKVSIGGDRLRLVISNELCESALTVESMHIARLLVPGDPTIDAATDTVVTFGGKESVTVSAGRTVTSDEISFSSAAGDILAVSTKYSDSVPAYPTCRKNAGCTAWLIDGNHVSDETFERMSLMSSTYFLSRIDVWAAAGTETVVCCGDFISDVSGYNGFNSWVEQLSVELHKINEAQSISTVTYALSDNSIAWALENIEEKILTIPGVRGVILQIGDNDISLAQADTSEKLIESIKKIIEICHARGVSMYACTIPPFEGNTVYYSELHEKIRGAVNLYITNPSSGLDGYVDFAQVLCYAEKPAKMQPQYDSGDGITPNPEGQKVMGKAAAEMMIDVLAERTADRK